jgi:chemotaxis protein methyltransferase CheR
MGMSSSVTEAMGEALFAGRRLQGVRLAGAAYVQEGVRLLRDDLGLPLQRASMEASAIQQTSFFRDARVWESLRSEVMPRLIRQRMGRMAGRLRIWSVACSTGQEAYSLAMMLCEIPELAGWDVKVLATDSSGAAVEYARRGRYSRGEVERGLTPTMRDKYMERDGDDWVVCERARAMCEFERAVVDDGLPVGEPFDLVLLRNLLLYFSDEERTQVFEAVWRRMDSRGCLLLGRAEQAEESTPLFEGEMVEDCLFYWPVRGSAAGLGERSCFARSEPNSSPSPHLIR